MRFGIRKLLWAAAVVAVLCALYGAARQLYYAERIRVQSILAEVQGISDIRLHSHVDVTEEINSITVSVDGIPDSSITFGGFGDYRDSGQFSLGRLGKWQFRVHGRRHLGAYVASTGEPVESDYWGYHITLGAGSPYNQLLPFEINTIQDLVDHYADFVELLGTWPDEATPGTVILQDGTTQFYGVVADPLPAQ